MKRKVNCTEISVEITLLRLPYIVKAAPETWPNPRVKLNSTVVRSFQQETCWEMDIMPNMNFVHSDSNNKDQLKGLHNYLNQKIITASNTYDSSRLGNNLITYEPPSRLLYMSPSVIPAEAVKNNHVISLVNLCA